MTPCDIFSRWLSPLDSHPCIAKLFEKFCRVEGLKNNGCRAQRAEALHRVCMSNRCKEYDWSVLKSAERADTAYCVITGHIWHHGVYKKQIWLEIGYPLNSFISACARADLKITDVGQSEFGNNADVFLVVYMQYLS